MKKTATALIVSLLAILVQPVSDARAQYFNANQLRKVKAVEVLVVDGVRDGCLPRPGILKTEAELILRRSGIKVEAGSNPHKIQIIVTGFELERGETPIGSCVAKLGVEVWRFESLLDGTIGMVTASTGSSLLDGDKDTFQNQLRNMVNEKVTELANEILKAQ